MLDLHLNKTQDSWFTP